MADLLSLFRGQKPTGSRPRTTTPSSTAPIVEDPVRSGAAPPITQTNVYEVVVPQPAPIRNDQPLLNPGSAGVINQPDTTGLFFVESQFATPPAVIQSTFFRTNGSETTKTTVDGPLPGRLYEMFKRGRS